MIGISQKYKCTVLGANGYLGRHLTYMLNKDGHQVFAYGKDKFKNENLAPEISYGNIDLTQKKDIDRINFEVDYLFYFAGLTGTINGFDNYEKYLLTNELGLLNVLDGMRKMNKKSHVIFPSTRLVYKGSIFPLKENDPKETKTVYAVNKLSGENILQSYSNAFGIPFTVFRICVPYGNLFDHNFSFGTIGNLIKTARDNQNIVLYGDGSQKRTFTNIISLGDQIITSLNSQGITNEIFNIGGEAFALKDVAQMIATKYGVNVEYIPWPQMDLLIESGDTVFDSEKLSEIIGYEKKYSFKGWVDSI